MNFLVKSHREPHRQFPELAAFSSGGSRRENSTDFLCFQPGLLPDILESVAPKNRPGAWRLLEWVPWQGTCLRTMFFWPPAEATAQLRQGLPSVLVTFLDHEEHCFLACSPWPAQPASLQHQDYLRRNSISQGAEASPNEALIKKMPCRSAHRPV